MNVEEGAGVESSFNNKDYEAAGAKVTNAANVYKSNILLKVLSNQIRSNLLNNKGLKATYRLLKQ